MDFTLKIMDSTRNMMAFLVKNAGLGEDKQAVARLEELKETLNRQLEHTVMARYKKEMTTKRAIEARMSELTEELQTLQVNFVFKMMDFVLKNDEFCIKMMNFALKLRNLQGGHGRFQARRMR